VVPQRRSGSVRKNSLPPGFDPRTVQSVASRKDLLDVTILKRRVIYTSSEANRNVFLCIVRDVLPLRMRESAMMWDSSYTEY
jgi:hypothetical protein